MAEVKWIKIVTDVFDDDKIKLIENMPEADSIIVIWFKLLCLAGKQNRDGFLFLNDKIAYTDEMLSTIFRRPLNTVRLALSTFEQFDMIEVVDGAICITKWEKHQNIEGLEKIKEQNRLRQAKYKKKQKLLAGNVSGNVTVTEGNAIEVDVDKEKEIDKDLFTTTTGDAPSLTEVYVYFKEFLIEDAAKEAEKFIAYNAHKGWSCLPDWKVTADLWIARIKE